MQLLSPYNYIYIVSHNFVIIFKLSHLSPSLQIHIFRELFRNNYKIRQSLLWPFSSDGLEALRGPGWVWITFRAAVILHTLVTLPWIAKVDSLQLYWLLQNLTFFYVQRILPVFHYRSWKYEILIFPDFLAARIWTHDPDPINQMHNGLRSRTQQCQEVGLCLAAIAVVASLSSQGTTTELKVEVSTARAFSPEQF